MVTESMKRKTEEAERKKREAMSQRKATVDKSNIGTAKETPNTSGQIKKEFTRDGKTFKNPDRSPNKMVRVVGFKGEPLEYEIGLAKRYMEAGKIPKQKIE